MGDWVFVDSANSSADKIYASLPCTVIEFLIPFAGAADVNVENVNFHVLLVLLFKLHHMFEGVHATEVATVGVMLFVSAADALDEGYAVGFGSVALADDFAACRSCS